MVLVMTSSMSTTLQVARQDRLSEEDALKEASEVAVAAKMAMSCCLIELTNTLCTFILANLVAIRAEWFFMARCHWSVCGLGAVAHAKTLINLESIESTREDKIAIES